MATFVLDDVKACEWKQIPLMARLEEWTDTRKQTAAVHTFLKVDGARVERMGRAAHRFKLAVVYMGASWRRDYVNLLASIDENPKGLLIHPMLGSMQAFCLGTEGAKVVPGRERNVVVVPLEFIEDNLDQALSRELERSVPAARQKLAAAILDIAVDNFEFAAKTAALIEKVAAQATAYSASVEAAATDASASTALDQQLDAIAPAVDAAVAAVRDDAATSSDQEAYAVVRLIERVYAAALDLEVALAVRRPAVVTYTARATTHIATIAAEIYGPEGRGRVEELLARNPWIRNPAAIPGGSVLSVAQPKV